MTCLIRSIGIAAALLVAGVSSLASADVYRCIEDGKTIYSDKPCPAGTGVKMGVKPNTVGEVDQSTFKVKREAIDKRIGNKVAADDADRARDAATMAKRNARCQGYVDEAYRQAAWLSSYSLAVQQSASTEIAIQRRKFESVGCGKRP